MIIFSLPKKSEGHIDLIQKNAISSWRKLAPKPEIVLLKDEEAEKNEFGTPLVNELFYSIFKNHKSDYYAYVNADIILTQSFMHTFELVKKQFKHFLIIGRRYNVKVKEPIDFSKDWEKRLFKNVGRSAKLGGSGWVDYLIFSKDVYKKIPPFAIGRTFWDKWLVWEAMRQGIAVIDATDSILAIHQSHSYSHVKGGKNEVWSGHEAKENIRLAGGWTHGAAIDDAHYYISGGVIHYKSFAFFLIKSYFLLFKKLGDIPFLFEVILFIRKFLNRKYIHE